MNLLQVSWLRRSFRWHSSIRSWPGRKAVYTGTVPGTGAGGYDVVAYFSEGKARPRLKRGSTAIHEGITYRFASEANRAVFLGEPARYLPQYGGYCAWAVANGYTAHGDPEQWTVHDGRLYLNYSRAVRLALGNANIPGHVTSGDANWPEGARRVAEPPKAEVDKGRSRWRRRMEFGYNPLPAFISVWNRQCGQYLDLLRPCDGERHRPGRPDGHGHALRCSAHQMRFDLAEGFPLVNHQEAACEIDRPRALMVPERR